MTDLQRLVDTMSRAMRETRSNYHMTLGGLISRLSEIGRSGMGNAKVVVDLGGSPGSFMSYRGYYDDLSLDRSGDGVTVQELLKKCETALGKHFTGYKGGEYLMDESTPLWVSEYGSASGIAIIDILLQGDRYELVTKTVD